MSWRTTILIAMTAAALGACEKRTRTRNSSGSSDKLLDDTPVAATAPKFRFNGPQQALDAARKAAAEEKWDEAVAATDALLKQQPDDPQAKVLNERARAELANLAHYQQFTKAAGANQSGAAVMQYGKTAMHKYHIPFCLCSMNIVILCTFPHCVFCIGIAYGFCLDPYFKQTHGGSVSHS